MRVKWCSIEKGEKEKHSIICKIIEMLRLYAKYGNYAEVGRQIGRSGSTVAKYEKWTVYRKVSELQHRICHKKVSVFMEEKIIEAKFTKNKLANGVLIASIALIVLGFFIALIAYKTGEGRTWYGGYAPLRYIYDSFFEYFLSQLNIIIYYDEAIFAYFLYTGIIGIILSFFFNWEMGRCALTVTNRRVTGKASFGKSVDLPLNQISAIALGSLSRITVATSSGRIHFWFIKNRNEVHSALNNIIGKVQVESVYKQHNNSISEADEIKKYKELLENGTITQEEFDAKKKQLLGL